MDKEKTVQDKQNDFLQEMEKKSYYFTWRDINPRLIEYTAHKAFWTAYNWLEEHDTPREILDLLQNEQFITSHTPELRAGKLSNMDMGGGILPCFLESIDLIFKMGGSFEDSLGYDPTEGVEYKIPEPAPAA